MNQTIVEISDILLRASQAGSESYAEPGIALLKPQAEPVLGMAAQQNLRQQPTRIHSRYWSDLSTDPLQINNTAVRHTADLVWHQMSDLKTKTASEAVSLCVPSNLSQSQIQLLTGICQSLELDIGPVINLGLAQLFGHSQNQQLAQQNQITHLDLQLHQLVATDYQQTESGLVVKGHEIIQDISFLRLIDRLLYQLRDKFILSSRFDPLHSGDTEQQLFDQLLQRIDSGSNAAFQVENAQKQYSTELSPQELSSLMTEFKTELSSRLTLTNRFIAYAPIFSALPGFQFSDSELPLTTVDTRLGAEQLIGLQGETEGIVHIRQAPIKKVPTKQTPAKTATNATTQTSGLPTEAVSSSTAVPADALLFENKVYPAGSIAKLIASGFPENVLALDGSAIVLQSSDAKINGHSGSPGQVVCAGDRIQTSQSPAELVAVCLVD